MTIIKTLLLTALAAGVALAVAAPSQAWPKMDYCRWASKNAHICWYYDGTAFHACDDQADHHRVRVQIKSRETTTTDPRSNTYFVNVPRKTRHRKRACTQIIREPGGPKNFVFWQFRMCIRHEGCTLWRYCQNGRRV